MKYNWITDVKNWNTIGKDTATLLLALAERRLTETVTTAEDVTKKTDRLLALAVPLVTLAIGYLLKDERGQTEDEFLNTFAIISLFPLCVAMFFLARNYMPYDVEVPGASPENIFTSERLDMDLDEGTEYRYIVSLQLQTYQNRIHHNTDCNKRRRLNNNIAQWSLVSLPAFLFLVFLVCL